MYQSCTDTATSLEKMFLVFLFILKVKLSKAAVRLPVFFPVVLNFKSAILLWTFANETGYKWSLGSLSIAFGKFDFLGFW